MATPHHNQKKTLAIFFFVLEIINAIADTFRRMPKRRTETCSPDLGDTATQPEADSEPGSGSDSESDSEPKEAPASPTPPDKPPAAV